MSGLHVWVSMVAVITAGAYAFGVGIDLLSDGVVREGKILFLVGVFLLTCAPILCVFDNRR